MYGSANVNRDFIQSDNKGIGAIRLGDWLESGKKQKPERHLPNLKRKSGTETA